MLKTQCALKTLVTIHEIYLWGSLLKVRGDAAFLKIIQKVFLKKSDQFQLATLMST